MVDDEGETRLKEPCELREEPRLSVMACTPGTSMPGILWLEARGSLVLECKERKLVKSGMRKTWQR